MLNIYSNVQNRCGLLHLNNCSFCLQRLSSLEFRTRKGHGKAPNGSKAFRGVHSFKQDNVILLYSMIDLFFFKLLQLISTQLSTKDISHRT